MNSLVLCLLCVAFAWAVPVPQGQSQSQNGTKNIGSSSEEDLSIEVIGVTGSPDQVLQDVLDDLKDLKEFLGKNEYDELVRQIQSHHLKLNGEQLSS